MLFLQKLYISHFCKTKSSYSSWKKLYETANNKHRLACYSSFIESFIRVRFAVKEELVILCDMLSSRQTENTTKVSPWSTKALGERQPSQSNWKKRYAENTSTCISRLTDRQTYIARQLYRPSDDRLIKR